MSEAHTLDPFVAKQIEIQHCSTSNGVVIPRQRSHRRENPPDERYRGTLSLAPRIYEGGRATQWQGESPAAAGKASSVTASPCQVACGQPGRGSDMPPACHSLPRLRFAYPQRESQERFAPCSKSKFRAARAIRQEVSDRIFAPIQSLENEGIPYVFLVFQTEEVGQKDGGDSQTQLCGVAINCCSAEYLCAHTKQRSHSEPQTGSE